jgi:hypothetical protein
MSFAWILFVVETLFYGIYTMVALKILELHWSKVVAVHLYIVLAGIICMIPILVLSAVLNMMETPSTISLLCQVLVGATALFTYVFLVPPKVLRVEMEKRFFGRDFVAFGFPLLQSFLIWYKHSLEIKRANSLDLS